MNRILEDTNDETRKTELQELLASIDTAVLEATTSAREYSRNSGVSAHLLIINLKFDQFLASF